MDTEEISIAREEREEFRNEIIAQNEIGNIQMDRRVMIFGFAALAVFLAGIGIAFFYDLSTGLLIIILSFAINIISHIRQVSSNVVKASHITYE